MTPVPRLAVLISGGGRTLMNLADVIERGELDAEIALVIASRQCEGVRRARERGLPVEVMAGPLRADRFERLLRRHEVDWVVLAGFLQLLEIPPSYEGRVVNIHPALLPRFGGRGMYGQRVHRAVLESGETETGCTVHLCDADYDTGPIVLQARVPVEPGDTVESLGARVFEAEKRAYPEALRMLLSGAWTPEGARR